MVAAAVAATVWIALETLPPASIQHVTMLEGFMCLAVLREGSTLGANALNVPVTGTMVCAKAASAVSVALKHIAVLAGDLAF